MKNYILPYLFLLLYIACADQNNKLSVKHKEAEQLIDSLIATDLSVAIKIKTAREKGFSYYDSGDFNSARTLFKYCYDLAPHDITNQYAMALVSSLDGNFDESLALLKEVIAADSLAFLSAYGSMATIHTFRNEFQKADAIVDRMLKSNNQRIKKEAYSVASAICIRRNAMSEAIDLLKQRIPLSKRLYSAASPALEHPYWDYHLISGIYLTFHQPDSAKAYIEQGIALADSTIDARAVRYIKSDYNYFMAMYYLQKRQYNKAYAVISEKLNENQNGYGGIWSRMLIEKNQPDSALVLLNKYGRHGYYTTFLKGKSHLKSGNIQMAASLFKEVLNFHQLGEWYWQHEYALISSEIEEIYLEYPELKEME